VRVLSILSEAPYGSERSYNGLRLMLALGKRDEMAQRVFLMADAVGCARAGQTTPEGYYNLERMLHGVLRTGAEVGLCGSCMDARGLVEADLIAGCRRSSMSELADWTVWADKVVSW
jgi:uncharacterized protein involved in oxidation of intracellular sulfur